MYSVHTRGNGFFQKTKPSAKTNSSGVLFGINAFGSAFHAAVFRGYFANFKPYLLVKKQK